MNYTTQGMRVCHVKLQCGPTKSMLRKVLFKSHQTQEGVVCSWGLSASFFLLSMLLPR